MIPIYHDKAPIPPIFICKPSFFWGAVSPGAREIQYEKLGMLVFLLTSEISILEKYVRFMNKYLINS